MALDAELSMRVDGDELSTFKEKCNTSLNRPYQVMIREMITAVNEGRLKITIPEEQRESVKEIYDVD